MTGAFQEPFLRSKAEGFGHVRDLEHVAGFQSHRYRRLPTLSEDEQAEGRWRLARLELVSLLRHEHPAVYLSEDLPRMDELQDAPTRALDAFEQRALASLEQGESLSIENGLNEIRMVGAIRAVKQCIECHQVQRGELLGAFSYRLIREPAARRHQPPLKPQAATLPDNATVAALCLDGRGTSSALGPAD